MVFKQNHFSAYSLWVLNQHFFNAYSLWVFHQFMATLETRTLVLKFWKRGVGQTQGLLHIDQKAAQRLSILFSNSSQQNTI